MEAEARKQRREAKPAAFELCDVCNLNHDQGRRHRYAASHRRNLSAVLSRFQSKLSDLRFFLRHPAPLRPEHSALNRLWCVFCALDLQELGSRFVCSNIITHLASPEHLKSVKDYLWKHGGGMDRIDTFRVCETDFVKWEQSCNSLQNATTLSTEGSIGPKPGPAKGTRIIKYGTQKSATVHLLPQLHILLVLHQLMSCQMPGCPLFSISVLL